METTIVYEGYIRVILRLYYFLVATWHVRFVAAAPGRVGTRHPVLRMCCLSTFF